MKAKDAILTRRSCRKFIPDKLVPKEVIDDILLAGRSAPTGMNTQLVKFHVVFNNTKLLQSIGEKCFNGLPAEVKQRFIDRKNNYSLTDPIFYDAPCAIILTYEKTGKKRDSLDFDAGLACGNILTMATSYGLGGIPVGIAKLGDEAAVLEGVGTNKEKEELLLCIPIGYEAPEWREKFLTKKELTSKVNWVK